MRTNYPVTPDGRYLLTPDGQSLVCIDFTLTMIQAIMNRVSHSPHQSPHVVMTPHHIVRYPLIEDKERAQQHGSPPV
jgi:hypothetical protein